MTPQARRKFRLALNGVIRTRKQMTCDEVMALQRLYAVVDELATSDRKKFLDVLERLGNSPTARIDARKWWDHFRDPTQKRQ